jgi:hypothetical protein
VKPFEFKVYYSLLIRLILESQRLLSSKNLNHQDINVRNLKFFKFKITLKRRLISLYL